MTQQDEAKYGITAEVREAWKVSRFERDIGGPVSDMFAALADALLAQLAARMEAEHTVDFIEAGKSAAHGYQPEHFERSRYHDFECSACKLFDEHRIKAYWLKAAQALLEGNANE